MIRWEPNHVDRATCMLQEYSMCPDLSPRGQTQLHRAARMLCAGELAKIDENLSRLDVIMSAADTATCAILQYVFGVSFGALPFMVAMGVLGEGDDAVLMCEIDEPDGPEHKVLSKHPLRLERELRKRCYQTVVESIGHADADTEAWLNRRFEERMLQRWTVVQPAG